ncbi:metal-dependent transcriptional regulator [bacterium]|nr:metal-dependent transcriptional regulator [bacterium]
MSYISSNLEDYLEVIGKLVTDGKSATVSAIARIMGVSRPSVTQIVSKMIEMGLVQHVPYGDVKLTSFGEEIAQKIARRHKLLFRFLRDLLNVPPDIADKEACEIEHSIGPETTLRLAAFVDFIDSFHGTPEWLDHFHEFLKTNELPSICLSCKNLVENKKKNGKIK